MYHLFLPLDGGGQVGVKLWHLLSVYPIKGGELKKDA